MNKTNRKERNLVPVYYTVRRNNKMESVSISDMTLVEREMLLRDKDAEYLKNLCHILVQAIARIGEDLDITVEDLCRVDDNE